MRHDLPLFAGFAFAFACLAGCARHEDAATTDAAASATASTAPSPPPPVTTTAPPPAAAPHTSDLQPLTEAGLVELFTKLAASEHASASGDEIADAVKHHLAGKDGDLAKLAAKLEVPLDSGGALMKAYRIDVDNDGAPNFVVVDTNTTGLHNDRIEAVYAIDGDRLTPVKLPPGSPIAKAITYFAGPFGHAGDKVTIALREGTGLSAMTARYVWKGGAVTLLDRAPAGH